MTEQQTRATQPSAGGGRADLLVAAGVAALLIALVTAYGAELSAMLAGLLGFSTAGLLLLVALIAAALAFAGMPLLVGDGPAEAGTPALRGTARQNRALEILYAEKLRLLRAIRDLDFDYDMGKLIDATYTEQRVLLIRQAIAVLARIDALEETIAAQQHRIEAALNAFRQEHT